MTAIAGITDGTTVWLAADSAGVSGSSLSIRADEKVFTSGPYVIGYTTSFRMGQLLRYGFTPPEPKPDADLLEHMCCVFVDALRERFKAGGFATKDKEQESGGNFLVGVHGRLFEIWADYQVAEYGQPYAATGCGEDFVLGSLHTTHTAALQDLGPQLRLKLALQAAERFSTGVAGPFRFVNTETP